MVDKKDTMIRAAYQALGSRNPKKTIFFLGGAWKVPAAVVAVAGFLAAGVLAIRWIVQVMHSHLGPAVAVLAVGAFVAALVIAFTRPPSYGRGRRYHR